MHSRCMFKVNSLWQLNLLMQNANQEKQRLPWLAVSFEGTRSSLFQGRRLVSLLHLVLYVCPHVYVCVCVCAKMFLPYYTIWGKPITFFALPCVHACIYVCEADRNSIPAYSRVQGRKEERKTRQDKTRPTVLMTWLRGLILSLRHA